MNKKGLSAVVASLLIVVVTVVAVIMVWSVVKKSLDNSSTDVVKMECAKIDFSFDKCTTKDINGTYIATYSSGEASKIIVTLENAIGDSNQSMHTNPVVGAKISGNLNLANSTKVSAIAFVKNEAGEEVSCTVVDTQACTA